MRLRHWGGSDEGAHALAGSGELLGNIRRTLSLVAGCSGGAGLWAPVSQISHFVLHQSRDLLQAIRQLHLLSQRVLI